jgi:DNA/RNA-binding domain of Phe-tRNA-synthetase-like protein
VSVTVEAAVDIPFAALELWELEVTEPRVDFHEEVEAALAAARDGAVAGTQRSRDLYRRFGVDPTRHRPSSEALLRRARKGDWPRVNSLVDVGNVMSLLLQVPVGLHDLGAVSGQRLTLRLGAAGESYEGIGKDRVNVAERLCLADEEGACGSPTSDSARTRITTDTDRALWLYYLPVPADAIDRTAELVARYGRGLTRVLVS